ncbi:MAG: flagellar hook capping protein [Planctomycetales bacterium]|nr:flagellar hook capping protein [Planctomycetales bacterium]
MSQIPSVGQSGLSGNNEELNNALRGLDVDEFFQLMIAELQNQDPLNPLENSEMLQQISQIREVGATERLTDTLDSVLLGQNVSSATNLIGKSVRAIDNFGAPVEGVVDRVTIIDGEPTLHVGEAEVKLSNVAEIKSIAGE